MDHGFRSRCSAVADEIKVRYHALVMCPQLFDADPQVVVGLAQFLCFVSVLLVVDDGGSV